MSATESSDVCVQQSLSQEEARIEARFCCNICLEAVVEPVVTQCGHLYCWPCLYRWLEPGMYPAERAALGLMGSLHAINESRRVCPVCKASCAVPTLVPIYVRSIETEKVSKEQELNDEMDSRDAEMTGLRQRIVSRDSTESESVPSRPAAQSPRTTSPSSPTTPPNYRNNTPVWITPLSPTAHRASLSHGLLRSFQQQQQQYLRDSGVPPLHRTRMQETELETHPDATEYLSRLLIMLGSFVLLCLLLL